MDMPTVNTRGLTEKKKKKQNIGVGNYNQSTLMLTLPLEDVAAWLYSLICSQVSQRYCSKTILNYLQKGESEVLQQVLQQGNTHLSAIR